jgi:hypothetical protein
VPCQPCQPHHPCTSRLTTIRNPLLSALDSVAAPFAVGSTQATCPGQQPYEAGWTFAGPPAASPNTTIPSAVGVPQQVQLVHSSRTADGAASERSADRHAPTLGPGVLHSPLLRLAHAPTHPAARRAPALPQVHDNGLIAKRVLGFCWLPPSTNTKCGANSTQPLSYNVLGPATPKARARAAPKAAGRRHAARERRSPRRSAWRSARARGASRPAARGSPRRRPFPPPPPASKNRASRTPAW